MNNHPHGIGAMGGGHPGPISMSFHKGQAGPLAAVGGPSGNGGSGPGTILPANVVPSTHTNNFMNRKKINT